MAQDLRRTPTSTGNQKVFTYSCWIKRNGLTDWARLLSIMTGSGDAIIQLTNVDKLRFRDEVTSPDTDYISSRPLRDVGSWMHVLVAIDTTAIQAEHRIRMYVNGDSLIEHGLDTESMPGDRNLDFQFNDSGLEHRFFARNNDSEYFLGEAFDLFWVDGQALTPDVFGFNKDGDGYISVGSTQATDFRPGQWVPKSPRTIKSEINRRGGFGVNGFYLPMNDSSNFGADFHCAPDSIIKLKGEDLPQPRNGAPTTSDAYVSQLRSDSYAANLVLAVPGISGGQDSGYGDYSADIKGSGSNRTSTRQNVSIATTAGYYGTAISTVGASDFLYYDLDGSGANAYGTGDFTFECWFYATEEPSAWGILMKHATNGSWNNGITLCSKHNTTRKFTIYTQDGSSNVQIIGGTVWALNQWHHVVVERYNGQITLYVNGVAEATRADTRNYAVAGTPASSAQYALSIGAQSDGNYTSNGYFQDVRVYRGVAKYKGGFDVPKPYTPVGFEGGSWRQVSDTCKNNFATLNPLDAVTSNQSGTDYTQATHSNGNLTVILSDDFSSARGSIGISTGKYYWEIRVDDNYNAVGMGVIAPGNQLTSYSAGANGASYEPRSDRFRKNGVNSYDGTNNKTDDGLIVGVALDKNVGIISFFADGTLLSNGTMTGLNALSDVHIPECFTYNDGSNVDNTYTWNFGQNLTFSDILGNKGNRLNSSNNSWTLTYGGSQGNFTVADDGVTLSGTTASSAYMRATYTLDPKKKYIISLKYTAGSNNQLSIQDDKGYITTTDGTATTALQVGNHYAAVISASTSVVITASNWNTSYTINNIHLSEYDAGYTDDSGKGKFQYQPPTGFLALCEDNLPTPAIADPGEHFKTVLYTGNGSARGITGVGFKPDFVWIKNRDSTYQHQVYDSVRGAGQKLLPSTTNAESTDTANVSSFDSNGFSFAGGNVGVNQDTKNHVAWCWKAGGAAVANTDGSIASQVSVNQTAGFSIVSYTGTGSGGTVGHGLGKRPKIVLVKRRDASTNWPMFVDGISNNTNDFLQLNLTNATATAGNFFNTGNTTTTTFPLGTGDGQTNASGSGHIAYCWAEIPGYSRFSTYQGTGQSDGPFVYCGFKPAWVMVKSSSNGSTNWRIWDSSRGPINSNNLDLLANTTHIENAHGSDDIDLLSNGFKIRSTGSWHNLSGGSFIFMAFAESPFQTANAK